MKIFNNLHIITLLLVMSSCAVAQPTTHYTSTNKKAIKAFQEGEKCYNTIDVRGKKDNQCIEKNYKKAIEIDKNFMEAYMTLMEHYVSVREYDKAIDIIKKSHAIDPDFFINSWFFLAELEHKQGKYNEALKDIDQFILFTKNNVPKDMIEDVQTIKESCEFAIDAMKHPLQFNPINLGQGVNTKYPEYFPTITGDDKMLLFTRRIPDAEATYGEQEDFFYSINQNGKWGKAEGISNSINTVLNEGAPSLSSDGQVIIFTACDLMGLGDYGPGREGSGSCDLFYSQKTNGKWTRAVNMGSTINSANWESQPSYSADGRSLYFIRKSRGNKSGTLNGDIMVSFIDEDGAWTIPQRLPDYINTTSHESSVLIHPDGQTLYFSSNGHVGMGGFDIYMCRMQPDGKWGKPVNLGYPINTNSDENSLLVSSSGEIAFFASDRAGGYGDLDLYSFDLDKSIRPVYTTYMKGSVYDKVTNSKLQARFELIDLDNGKVVMESVSNESGEFLINIATNKNYGLNINKKGYTFYSENFSFKDDGIAKDKVFVKDVPLIPITDVEAPRVLENIFFDTDKYDLKAKSFIELDKLAVMLNENPKMKIELHGHTDSDGDDAHNMTLSQNRANSVMNYLILKGIAKERLKAKGFGETQPRETNDTAEGRAKNRRTEYIFIK